MLLFAKKFFAACSQPNTVAVPGILHNRIAGEAGLDTAIDVLLAVKRESPETGLSPQIVPILKFVGRGLARVKHITPVRNNGGKAKPLLSDLFRATLKETWG